MLVLLSFLASAATLHVDPASTAGGSADGSPGAPYATVTAALSDASASDTLVLAEGTYAESVTVNVDVTNIGQSDLTSVVTMPWTLSTSGVTLDSLRFVGTGTGTAVQASRPFTVQNSQIENFQVGVRTDGVASGGLVRRNRILHTLFPVFLVNSGWSTYVMVENNILTGRGGSGFGVYTYDTRWRGYHNAISDVSYGVYHYLPSTRNLPISYLHGNLISASTVGVQGGNLDAHELKVYTNAITAPTAVSGVPSSDQVGQLASDCGQPSGLWDHGFEPGGACVDGALFGTDPDGTQADIGPYGGPQGGPFWLDVSCRGPRLVCPPDLDGWLEDRPDVRDSMVFLDLYDAMSNVDYDDWSPELRRDLRHWFLKIHYDKAPVLVDPPPHIGTSSQAPRISWDDGRNLYLSNVGQSLVTELDGLVPWTVDDYDSDALETLFHYGEGGGGGFCVGSPCSDPDEWHLTMSSSAMPMSGPATLQALDGAGYIGTTRKDTIGELLAFMRDNVVHFGGSGFAVNQYYWNYQGATVSGVFYGTDPDGVHPTFGYGHGFGRWTAGCHGTNRFLQHMLRPVNIPVAYHAHGSGHATPHFQSEDTWLSHGDDPYNGLARGVDYDGAELMIDDATYASWLGGTSSTANIGRRTSEIAVEYHTPYLQDARCDDFASGASKADGDVFALIDNAFTLAELSAMGFWADLDATIDGEGTCSVPMPFGSG